MDSAELFIGGISVDKKEIGRRIREIRESITPDSGQKKVTQEKFYSMICPDKISDGQKQVSAWERGSMPSLEILIKIATLGHKSLDWLILGKGAPGEGPRDMAAMENNNNLTLRDYCRLLFVDMHDKFKASWQVLYNGEEPSRLMIDIPLSQDLEGCTRYLKRESSKTLAYCANTMDDIYSHMPSKWDSDIRGLFENAMRQSINVFLAKVPAVPVENGGYTFKIKGEK
jgi:transcriptional regulator with XRE-family HTH domain